MESQSEKEEAAIIFGQMILVIMLLPLLFAYLGISKLVALVGELTGKTRS